MLSRVLHSPQNAYNVSFKLLDVRYTKEIDNCMPSQKYNISLATAW